LKNNKPLSHPEIPQRVFIFTGDFIMDSIVLLDFQTFLIKNKYKNVLQELKLEHCTDTQGEYISLNVLRIKKNQKNKGYGSMVIGDIVGFADNQNVRIRLYATNLWGADINRLYEFYKKNGFVLIKNANDGKMMYYPKKPK
jgi:GNAT superfamily N-acetyltransferase